MSYEGHGISVTLGRTAILHGVDFDARAKEITAIVGPNGSGKTTLLRALCGDVAFAGRVTIDGTDTTRLKGWQLALRRGVLPQASQLAFPFTVIEVVRLGLMSGASARRDDLPERALATVGLSGRGGRLYQEMSGGEQQRVQLARVLAQLWEPVLDGAARWLLLDEPVASLDIGHQLMVMRLARDYAAAGGGVIAVMHDLNLTAMFANRVVLMHRGRVMAAGRADEVLTDDTLTAAYGPALRVNRVPADGGTFILPHSTEL